MSVAVISDERSFISTYVKLMDISVNAPADNFHTTADYRRLKSLGPSLPTIDLPMPPAAVSNDGEALLININFKSIKPPFKFNTKVGGVTATATIFKLKTALINSLPALKDAGVSPQDIKLMLKSKVMNDATVLSSLDLESSELSFNCLVNAPVVPVHASEAKGTTPVVTENTWSRITQILTEDIADKERVTQILSAFRNSINDTVLTLD